MRITLIRHLPTEWNHQQQLQGRRDIEISPVSVEYQQGVAENHRLLTKLAPFDLILASRLKRTHQTAQVYGYEPETEALLDELDFGSFEGKPKKHLKDTYGDLWIEHPEEIVLGESLLHLKKRIELFFEKYHSVHHLLAFGHGAWIRASISFSEYGHINNMNKIELKNNSCVTLTIKDREG
ncbi:histidine phosphatase family protein [Neobacillus sp. LXY-1]|uniref:histidine phosphatase family protein n=1 Tax=Neobacillus sp. LXY-1 TaxID=3379133 RepID=UPI003EE14926